MAGTVVAETGTAGGRSGPDPGAVSGVGAPSAPAVQYSRTRSDAGWASGQPWGATTAAHSPAAATVN